MSALSPHLGDTLQDLLDGRLAAAERSRADEHLAGCAECRRELEALRWVKQTARGAGAEPVPAGLAAAIAAALDAEDAGTGAGPERRAPAWPWTRVAVALGLVAVVGVALLVWRGRSGAGVPEGIARDHARYIAGGLPLQIKTTDAKELQRFFAAHGIPFETRVFDLDMMGYRVVGGRVHQVAGRPSALFVYEGPDGKVLLCQMYQGRLAELPRRAALREHDGILFHVHQRNGLTLVFWEEGPVVCVMASSIGAEEVIQLAFAKAIRVAAATLLHIGWALPVWAR